MFRPQRFSRSRRFTPPSNLQVYFALLPRAGFAFQGFSPLPSCTVSSTAYPFLTLSNALLLPGCPDSPDPTASPPRVWSKQRSVATDRGFSPADARSPLKFSLPRACLRIPWRHLHVPSAHDLARLLLTVTQAIGLQRIVGMRPVSLSLEKLPVQDSRPALLHHRSDTTPRDLRITCRALGRIHKVFKSISD
jgi:hypothetical protein